MKVKLFYMASLLALPLAAQTDLSSYQGPGVASPGVGNVGTASGQPVDLRFWAGVTGIYDTNIQPLVTDAKGNLIHVPNLYGTSTNVGAYGSRRWQHVQLALNYVGDYRYYPNNQTYGGTDQALTLGVTAQYSSRLVFDARVSGFTLSQTTGAVANASSAQGQTNGAPLFDSRNSAVSVSGSASFVQSPRTSYTIGAGASDYIYQSSGLSSYSGYNVSASAMHRVSLSNTLGGVYTYSYGTTSGGSFNSTAHTFAAQYVGVFGRFWTLNVTAGATISQVHELIAVQLPPILAFIFGVPSVTVPYDIQGVYPSGSVNLRRQFQRAVAFGGFSQAIGGGNGVFLGARNQSAHVGISYTGFRKLNFGADGNYQSSLNLGAGGGKLVTYGGGTGITYELMRYTHLTGRFDVGHYEFGGYAYRRTTERATFGLSFTPKDIPLSLW